MINTDLTNIIIGNQARIEQAIQTGAAWEIWMQTELHILLLNAGKQVAREIAYPAPNQLQHLDLAVQDNQGNYAIELKVESANNAGGVFNGAQADIVKIANFVAGSRWVIAIAYSINQKQILNNYAGVQVNNSIYAAGNNIGVMVTTV